MSADRVAEALAALEGAEKEATAGPWWVDSDPAFRHPGVEAAGHSVVVITDRFDEGIDHPPDAEFIAKFRNAAPALLKLASVSLAWVQQSYDATPTGKLYREGLARCLSELAEAVLG